MTHKEIEMNSIKKNMKLTIPAFLLIFVSICVIFMPMLLPEKPSDQSLDEAYQSPSKMHFFGTDKFGRDLFIRFLHGGRISLSVALLSVLFALSIGVPFGLLSGYKGGFVDTTMSWILNLFMAFPQFFLLLAIVAIFEPNSVWWIVIVIGALSWMDIARIVRNETLSLKEREFISACRIVGLSKKRILFRHVLPNLAVPILVYATLMVGNVILIESSLSFIGLGVQPPTPSWGNIINEGRDVLLSGWWISAFPGLAIVATVLAVNIFGEEMQRMNAIR